MLSRCLVILSVCGSVCFCGIIIFCVWWMCFLRMGVLFVCMGGCLI